LPVSITGLGKGIICSCGRLGSEGGSLTAVEVNAALFAGTKIANPFYDVPAQSNEIVLLYYDGDLGMPEEDNLAVTHVHGGQDTKKGHIRKVQGGSAPKCACGDHAS
jgi:hypothetical protein